MRRLADETPPFAVRTAGLGIFPGPSPVICLLVVRTRQLSRLHDRIRLAADGLGVGVNEYYSNDNWAPHISLAYSDVDRRTLPEAIDELAFEDFGWELMVDNVSLIVEPEGQIGTLEWRVPLAG